MNRKRFRIASLVVLAVMMIPVTAFADDGGFASYQAKGIVWMYLGAFGFGFLTSLTPCVYPMIPIVVGVFGARDEDVGRGKAMLLAGMYVLGMGILFATLGMVFAMLGEKSGFGSLLANPWVVVPVVMLYVTLAMSMFGAFEMNLPQSWQNKLNRVGGKGYGGAFGLGLVGGLTAAPCTGPFLVGMIAYVASTGNPAIGFTLLFTYALGLGVLFFVIAAFAVSLPKSGAWMEGVKSFGGVALLGAALYFLRPIVPIEKLGSAKITYLAASIALVVVGIVLGAIHLSFHAKASVKLRKGLGVALTVIGITGTVNWALTPDRYLPWQHDEQAAFELAKAEDKGVMVDFAAKWCLPCQELEHTFAEQDVFDVIVANYVPLRFDVTDLTEADEKLQDKYDAANLPAVLFLDRNGKELGRINKVVGGPAFLEVLEPATRKLRNPDVKVGSANEAPAAPEAP